MWHTVSLVVGLGLSHPAASGILVPHPEIKTESPALEGFLTEPPGKTALPLFFSSVQFSSVIQPCPTLCDPVNCSMPGLPVHHQLPESTQTPSIELVMLSNHLILCRPLLLLPSIFPVSGSSQMNHLFISGGQSIGVSVSTSVPPMNTQD